MRTFKLLRNEDISGVSGTGFVAEGIQFSSGKVAISFFPVEPTFVSAVVVYSSMDEVERIHGHEGATEVVWDKEEKPKRKKK